MDTAVIEKLYNFQEFPRVFPAWELEESATDRPVNDAFTQAGMREVHVNEWVKNAYWALPEPHEWGEFCGLALQAEQTAREMVSQQLLSPIPCQHLTALMQGAYSLATEHGLSLLPQC